MPPDLYAVKDLEVPGGQTLVGHALAHPGRLLGSARGATPETQRCLPGQEARQVRVGSVPLAAQHRVEVVEQR